MGHSLSDMPAKSASYCQDASPGLTSQTGLVPEQRIRLDLHQKQASCTRCAPSPSPVDPLRLFLTSQ